MEKVKNKNAELRRKDGCQGSACEQLSECSKLPSLPGTGKRKELESENVEEGRKSTRYTFTSDAKEIKAQGAEAEDKRSQLHADDSRKDVKFKCHYYNKRFP
jgi:hypothetical protein